MKRVAATALIIMALVLAPLQVAAETISISVTGNGSESVNTASVSESNQATVVQTNQSEVENKIEESHNTGGNQVNGNTASDVSVTTGDVNSHIQISNEDINTNVADTSCGQCQAGSSTEIKVVGNGTGSENTVSNKTSNNTTVVQTNNAIITTIVTQSANTGNNSVSSNTGSQVGLKTGSIEATSQIQNASVNLSMAKVNQAPSQLQVTIKENGAGSVNSISVSRHTPTTHVSHNSAKIVTVLAHNFNTGGNILDDNTAARVWLTTGSISSKTLVANIDINTNTSQTGCLGCVDPDDPTDPEDPTDPSDPGDPGKGDDKKDDNKDNNSDHSGNPGPAVGGRDRILGAILPETGGLSASILALNAASFLAGLWLKLRHHLVRLLSTNYVISFTLTW